MSSEKQIQLLELSEVINNEGATNKKNLDTLINEINQLIKTDFEKLLQLLYRVDVSEKKLRKKLKDNPDKDAAVTIAELIVERQQQKLKQRNLSPAKDSSIPEDEKW